MRSRLAHRSTEAPKVSNAAQRPFLAVGLLESIRHNPAIKDQLGNIEHEQWMSWVKAIPACEKLSLGRKERWEAYMVPYPRLPGLADQHDLEEVDRQIDAILANPVPRNEKELKDRLNRHELSQFLRWTNDMMRQENLSDELVALWRSYESGYDLLPAEQKAFHAQWSEQTAPIYILHAGTKMNGHASSNGQH